MSGRTCWLMVASVALLAVCVSGCQTGAKKATPAPSAETEMPTPQAGPEAAPGFTAPAGEAETTEAAPAAGEEVVPEAVAPHKAAPAKRKPAVTVAANVTMSSKAFSPKSVTIKVGQAVRWKNSSKATQSLTADSSRSKVKGSASVPKGAKSFSSGDLKSGATYTHTFPVAGTYKYFCIQGEKKGMFGTVTVKAASSKTTAKKTTVKKTTPKKKTTTSTQ